MANLADLYAFTPDNAVVREMWGFNNYLDHNELTQGMQRTMQFVNNAGLNLYFVTSGGLPIVFTSAFQANRQEWLLYPIDWEDWNRFALQHQQVHNQMNQTLNLPSSDLMDVDLERPQDVQAWSYLHFSEHQNARRKLGL